MNLVCAIRGWKVAEAAKVRQLCKPTASCSGSKPSCVHTSLLGSQLLPRRKNRNCTVSLWGSSSTLNRAIYYHSISKTCCWGEGKVMFVFEVFKLFFFFLCLFFFFSLNTEGSKPEVPSSLKELGRWHLWLDFLLDFSQIYLQWADRATSE